MRYVKIIIVTLLTMSGMSAYGQAVEVSLDKKVIYADSLNLAPSTSVATVLALLPELLERHIAGLSAISNYDIKIQSMSVGDASSDATLYQLRLNDIEKIEVSDSPVSSYLNNGQGGSIDITLRQPAMSERNTWGSASLCATSATDVMGQANVAYRTERLLIRGIAMADYYYGTDESVEQSFEAGKPAGPAATTSTTSKFWSQMARAYCTYNPTQRDELKFNLSQHRSGKRDKINSDAADATNPTKQYTTTTELQCYAKYEHDFGLRSKLEVEAQYVYSPQVSSYNTGTLRYYDSHKYSHNLGGSVKLTASPLPATSDAHYLDLALGCNINKSWVSQSLENLDNTFVDASIMHNDASGGSLFLMPYISAESTLGNFSFKAEAQYNIFRRTMAVKDDFKQHRYDFTCNMMAEWHINRAHTVRLTLNRALQRPSAEQSYPYLIYHPVDRVYSKGNVDLATVMLHQIGAEYVTYMRFGGHALQVNVGARYNHVGDIICQHNVGVTPPSGVIGLPLSYRTFINDGDNDIVSGNLMAIYSYRRVSISLAANLFHNDQQVSGGKDHYDYFNISLLPTWQLPGGWNTSAGIVYYSKVSRANSTLGACAHANLAVSKTLGPFNLSLYGTIGLDGKAKDSNTNAAEGSRSTKEYRPVSNRICVALNYLF